jgi:hypothetical protein
MAGCASAPLAGPAHLVGRTPPAVVAGQQAARLVPVLANTVPVAAEKQLRDASHATPPLSN